MPTPHPVTTTFLASCAAASSNGDGSVTPNAFPGVTLWPRVSESGAWAFGTASGIAMSAATLAELKGADANGDGTYAIRDANGDEINRVLVLTSAGAAEPGLPPPPKP